MQMYSHKLISGSKLIYSQTPPAYTFVILLVYTQTPPAYTFVILLVYTQTPPSLRATSPNLGEEPGYSADVNAIILSTSKLDHCWLSNEQGN